MTKISLNLYEYNTEIFLTSWKVIFNSWKALYSLLFYSINFEQDLKSVTVSVYLRFSQCFPLYFRGHLQTYSDNMGWQIPPLRHGLASGEVGHGGPSQRDITFWCSEPALSARFCHVWPLTMRRWIAPLRPLVIRASRLTSIKDLDQK